MYEVCTAEGNPAAAAGMGLLAQTYSVESAAFDLELLLTPILSFQSLGRSHHTSVADKQGQRQAPGIELGCKSFDTIQGCKVQRADLNRAGLTPFQGPNSVELLHRNAQTRIPSGHVDSQYFTV